MGSIAKGKRSMLKREIDVKAFCASKMLSGLTDTKTAKVASDTCEIHNPNDQSHTHFYIQTIREIQDASFLCVKHTVI